jgi:pimeloyl-ACP methyl ester carboxylesterase
MDSCKKWFDKSKIAEEKYYLLGHSLGGFLAGQYAAKYPENI